MAAPPSNAGEIQQAISTIVAWSTRNDVYQETMRRAKCGLPQGPVWLLARLAKSEPIRLSELAASLGVDNSTLNPQVQRLERDGLIARKPDPRDGRAALLHVTRTGRAALARLHKTRAEMFDEILAGWTDRDRAQAAAVLTRLAEQFDSWITGSVSPTPPATTNATVPHRQIPHPK
jgi:DNA-binding MarR family transcriptional regulator